MNTMTDTDTPVIVDFLGHCIFCLQPILSDPSTSSKRLTSFSHMWQYFHLKHTTNYQFQTAAANNETTTLSEIPPMCQTCCKFVVNVHGLHEYLEDIKQRLEKGQAQIQEIITKSTDQIKVFEKLLFHSSRNQDCVVNTIELLHCLRGTEEEQDIKIDEDDDNQCSELDESEMDSHSNCTSPDETLPLPGRFQRLNASSNLDNSQPIPQLLDSNKKSRRKQDLSKNLRGEDVNCDLISNTSGSHPLPLEKKIPLEEEEIKIDDDNYSEEENDSHHEPPEEPFQLHDGPRILNASINFTNSHPIPQFFYNSILNPPAIFTSTPVAMEKELHDIACEDEDEKPDLEIKSEEDLNKLKVNSKQAKIVNRYVPIAPNGPLPRIVPMDPLFMIPPKKTCTPAKPRKKKFPLKSKPNSGQGRLQRCEICGHNVYDSKMYDHYSTHVPEEFIHKCINPNCKLMFVSVQNLRRHYQCTKCEGCQEGAKKLPLSSCDTCPFTAQYLIGLKSHIGRHETLTKNHSCPFPSCPDKFSVLQSLHVHIDKHLYRGPTDRHKCSLCPYVISVTEMETHLKEVHKVELAVKCKNCSFVFPERTYLMDHLKIHSQEGVSCDICVDPVKYSRLSLLRKHYFTEHQIGEKFVCEYCNAELFTIESLRIHKSKHHGKTKTQVKNVQVFNCAVCIPFVTFKNHDTLLSHNMEKHGAEPYSCKTCGETFIHRIKLRYHERSHLGITVNTLSHDCDICRRSFHSDRELQLHKKIIHSTGPVEKEHVCDICGKQYHNVGGLRDHIKRVHERTGRVVCDICGKSLVGQNNLKKHRLIHTGERPHSCRICGQRFRQKETLATHVKSHETRGDKFCPKGPMERGVRKGKTTKKN